MKTKPILVLLAIACLAPFAGARMLDGARRGAAQEADLSQIARDAILHADVVYKRVGDLECTLDIILPRRPWLGKDGKPVFKNGFPCVLFYHGGGFIGGNRYLGPFDTRQYTDRGLALARVSYRFAKNGNTITDCVTDAFDAARFIAKNAAQYGIDPSLLLARGGSAGGCIGLLMNYANPSDFPGAPELADAKFRFNGAVLRNPLVFTVFATEETPEEKGIADGLVATPARETVTTGKRRISDADLERLAAGESVPGLHLDTKLSPISQIHAGVPRVLIVAGEKDTALSTRQHTLLRERARALGAEVTVWMVPGANHGLRGGKDCPLLPGMLDLIAAQNLRQMAFEAFTQNQSQP